MRIIAQPEKKRRRKKLQEKLGKPQKTKQNKKQRQLRNHKPQKNPTTYHLPPTTCRLPPTTYHLLEHRVIDQTPKKYQGYY